MSPHVFEDEHADDEDATGCPDLDTVVAVLSGVRKNSAGWVDCEGLDVVDSDIT